MRINAIFYIIIACLVLNVNMNAQQIDGPVKKGIININKWDFQTEKTINLEGQWEFYPEKFLDYEEYLTIKERKYIDVPQMWNDIEINGKKSGFGYGTYVINIDTGKYRGIFALKIKELLTAYTIFQNDKELLSVGVPGEDAEKSRASVQAKLIPIKLEKERETIIIHISNFNYYFGGIIRPIKLAPYDNLAGNKDFEMIMQSFIIGILILAGIYHYMIYKAMRNDRTTFYFSLFCILFALRAMFTEYRISTVVYPDINYEIAEKIEFLSFYLGVPIFVKFMNSMYPGLFSKKVANILFYFSAAFSIPVIILPSSLFPLTLSVYQVVTLLLIVYFIGIIIKGIIRKENDIILVTVGIVILFAAAVNDILFDQKIIKTAYIVPVGLGIFVIFNSLIIAGRYAKTYRRVEQLSDELNERKKQLEDYNKNLERTITERTVELQESNMKLKESLERLKYTQQELIVNEKMAMIGKFAGGVAHEINSPLTAVVTSAQMLVMDTDDIEDAETRSYFKENIDMIEKAAKQAKEIIARLIRKEEKSKKYFEETNLSDLVMSIEEEFMNLKKLEGIKIFTVIPNSFNVMLNEKDMNTVLRNIIQNAIEALNKTPYKEKYIKISTQNKDDTITLVIEDNGIGMTEAVRYKIYDPFFTTKDVGEGAGLGLTVAFDILKRHNYKIEIESVENKGTKVLIEMKGEGGGNKIA